LKPAKSGNLALLPTFKEDGDRARMIRPPYIFGRRSKDLEFEGVMRPHLDGIYGRAYALTGSVQDAEDLTQEVCIRASSRLEEVAQHENPRAWLMRVLYRLFVDLVRSRQRSPIRLMAHEDLQASLDAVSTEPGPEQQAEAATFLRRLRTAWERLTNDEQMLLALHGVEGLSLTEIQEVTGLPLGTIKSRLHRSRARLGKLLATADLTHRAETAAAADLGETSNAV
jgi:RNA polymerase sigma-70 factor (ECF subfamily)